MTNEQRLRLQVETLLKRIADLHSLNDALWVQNRELEKENRYLEKLSKLRLK